MSDKLIILDRDGVINYDSKDYITKFEHFQIFDGVCESIAKLSKAGYKIAVATNQSALGRKMTTLEIVNQIHQSLKDRVAQFGGKIDLIIFCPHHPDENCECRKPKDGMFKQISQKLNIPLKDAYMVGDSERDLIPAIKNEIKAVLVMTGNGPKTLEKMQLKNVLVVQDLPSFCDYLLN